jgi:hypothetical protein
VKTLSRVLQRLAIVTAVLGILVAAVAFAANYEALTAADSPRVAPGTIVWDDQVVPYYQTAEGRRHSATVTIEAILAIFLIPSALLLALAWVTKPASAPKKAFQITEAEKRAAIADWVAKNAPMELGATGGFRPTSKTS